MSSLPPQYWTPLGLLARASQRYFDDTGRRVVIVGGAAVSFYTQGTILSGDFDLIADMDFEPYLMAEGFQREADADRTPHGRSLRGYYHPSVPDLGVGSVSGALFEGRSGPDKLLMVGVPDSAAVVSASIEDLIADRLGEYAASKNRDSAILRQARPLFSLARDPDRVYLRRRIIEDTGDPRLIELL